MAKTESANDAIRRILVEGGSRFQLEQRLTRYMVERQLTVVKLCDNERHPAHPLCQIEGYCCFERAYQIGCIDGREGRPYQSQVMGHPKPKKAKRRSKR